MLKNSGGRHEERFPCNAYFKLSRIEKKILDKFCQTSFNGWHWEENNFLFAMLEKAKIISFLNVKLRWYFTCIKTGGKIVFTFYDTN